MSYFSFLNPKHWIEDPVDAMSRFGTYGLLGGDDLPYVGDSRKSERNYQEQKSAQEYTKQLQERIFEREDNSLQRRVEDAVLAGLNPQLALNGGAGTGQAIPLNVPQKQQTPNILDALSMGINLQTGLAALEGQNLSNEASKLNLDWYRNNGFPPSASGDVVAMLQAIGALLDGIKGNNGNGGVVPQVKGLISNAVDKANDSLSKIEPVSGDISTGMDFSSDYSLNSGIVPDGQYGDTKALKSEFGRRWDNIKKLAGNFWDKIKPKPSPTSGLSRQGYRKIGGAYVKK